MEMPLALAMASLGVAFSGARSLMEANPAP